MRQGSHTYSAGRRGGEATEDEWQQAAATIG